MADSRTLSMKFRNSDDSKATLTLSDPKEDLTAQAVKAAMNNIIVENVFDYDGADLAAPLSAVITVKTEQVLF